MPTVLVTGANRGLGLEFCRQFAEVNWTVIACCRNPGAALELVQLGENTAIQIEALDVSNFEQINALSNKLSNLKIDVLINNAGIYSDTKQAAFGSLDYQAWAQTFQVNTIAPVKLAEAFLNQIERSDKRMIVNISSLMGSVADNCSGGSILYRTSKAALNAAMKSLSIDLKNHAIGVLTLHPGWVLTDMGGANALISVAESVTGMRQLIENFSLSQSGSFLRYDGKPLPW
ncbi:MAG: SDR family oxidoreductase [Methylococcaceae bacterium]|nr:SDR family oxidoreductase [Methylococcaceae bacterium]